MSTTSSFIAAEDIRDFVVALKDWPNSEFGYDDYAIAVSPFTTFYFSYEPARFIETSLLMVDIHEAFEKLVGSPYRIGTHPESERPHPYGSKRLPDRRVSAQKTPLNKQFVFNASSEENARSSPATAGYFWRSSTWDGANNIDHSSIQLYFRWQWWLDHRTEWEEFVLSTADRLQADQVYSGFAIANPLDIGSRYEVAAWERALAPHFYGLDIDFPFGMSRELQDGIRPPTWGFLLSNRWREKLGLSREQVHAALAEAEIKIADRPCGQWIELGERPSLYAVEEGVPPLQAKLNRLLRPIRSQNLGLVGLGQWDGDPNERFGLVDTQRWLARFDEDGDWPDAQSRRMVPQSQVMRLRCEARQPCPRAGFWFTPAQIGSRRFFEQDEVMPEVGGDYGATIWQWDENQAPPKL
jgi:hypothetical protein